MPEIKPDMSERSRCISVHWSLPVQCILPCTHRENWHEAWHPESGNRIRYRRACGIFRTEELRNDEWAALDIQPPTETCGGSTGGPCEAERKLQAIKQLRAWKNEDGKFFVFADDLHEVMHSTGPDATRTDEEVAR